MHRMAMGPVCYDNTVTESKFEGNTVHYNNNNNKNKKQKRSGGPSWFREVRWGESLFTRLPGPAARHSAPADAIVFSGSADWREVARTRYKKKKKKKRQAENSAHTRYLKWRCRHVEEIWPGAIRQSTAETWDSDNVVVLQSMEWA